MDSQIQFFFEMMQNCYGVNGWEYDGELKVCFTNSQSPHLHRLLLLSFGRDQAILDAKRRVPMIVSDDLGLTWGIVNRCGGQEEPSGGFYALGPVFNKEITTQMMESMLASYDISMQNKWHLINELHRIPRVTTMVFFQQIIMLHYYVNHCKVRISDFEYDALARSGGDPEGADLWEDVPHATPLTENKLLDMVRTGNLEYHSALAEAGTVSVGIRTRSADPIRQAQYSVVAFITLCTRAAIEGGLSSEIAYTLNDTYTQSVDSAQSVSQVAAVSHTMYEDLIRRVNQARRESGISRPIRICCDYIDTHPDTELTLKQLARRAGYTEGYLARKFKAEMGMPLNAYIRKARIHRAKMLVSGTKLSIHDIADQLHFCSCSYFSEAFRKETGYSPAVYREKYRQ